LFVDNIKGNPADKVRSISNILIIYLTIYDPPDAFYGLVVNEMVNYFMDSIPTE